VHRLHKSGKIFAGSICGFSLSVYRFSLIDKGKGMQRIIRIICVLIIISGCESDQKVQTPEEKVAVKLVAVDRQQLALPIRVTGTVGTQEEMKLSFKIGGIMDSLFADEGAWVKKGQILASLKLDEIKAIRSQAKSAFEKADRDFQRVKALYADSVVTLEQIQNAETGLSIARAQLEIAEFNLKHAKIAAPEDGKVLKKWVQPNELIGAGHPVYLFGSGKREWMVSAGLTDREVVRCQVGDQSTVEVDAFPGKPMEAEIQEIAGAPDPMSGLFEVQLFMRSVDLPLKTGFTARVHIQPSDRSSVDLIPVISLINGNDHRGFVYSVIDSLAVQVPVTVAFLLENQVALKPLSGIDSVVAEGAAYLNPGSRVQIIHEKDSDGSIDIEGNK
jgi:multidrug efflux system membrane fusion protein